MTKIVYLKNRELSKLDSTLYGELYSDQTSEFDIDANWISVDVDQLNWKTRNRLSTTLRHRPDLLIQRAPRQQEEFRRAKDAFVPPPQPPGTYDVETRVLEYLDQHPEFDTEAGANILKMKLQQSPDADIAVLAVGLPMNADYSDALDQFYAAHQEYLRCTANDKLLVERIQPGLEPNLASLEQAASNCTLVSNPKFVAHQQYTTERAELLRQWKKVSNNIVPDEWSNDLLREQIRLRTSRASDLAKEVRDAQPRIQEPKLPERVCWPAGTWTSEGVADGIRQFPADAATIRWILKNDDVLTRRLFQRYSERQINERLGAPVTQQPGQQTSRLNLF